MGTSYTNEGGIDNLARERKKKGKSWVNWDWWGWDEVINWDCLFIHKESETRYKNA